MNVLNVGSSHTVVAVGRGIQMRSDDVGNDDQIAGAMRRNDPELDRHGNHHAGAAVHVAASAGANRTLYQRCLAIVAVEVTSG